MGLCASQCPFVLPCVAVVLWRPPPPPRNRARGTPPHPKLPLALGAEGPVDVAQTHKPDARPAGDGQLLRALLRLCRAILFYALIQVTSL
jgi:hypothetical protein